MQHFCEGPTFGAYISSKRKEKRLTQTRFLASAPELAFLTTQSLNDLEQDRLDPRTIADYDELIMVLARVLDAESSRLHDLANDFDRAFALQEQLQEQLVMEAVAFRARTEKG